MGAYSDEVLADAPEIYYRLGESSGPTATDLSGNARHGTYSGTPTFGVPGLADDADTAVAFNESETGATIGTDFVTTPSIDLTAAPGLSVAILIKPVDPATCHLLVYGPHTIFGDLNNLGVSSSPPDKAQFRFNGSEILQGTTDIDPDVEHCFLVTWDATSGEAVLYVDGVPEDSMIVTSFSPGSGAWVIAATDDTAVEARPRCVVDEFALYSYALAEARVVAQCEARSAAECDSSLPILAAEPFFYWPLGESVGTTAADESGNGRDGTYNGSPSLGEPGLVAGDPATSVGFDSVDDYVRLTDATPFTGVTLMARVKLGPDLFSGPSTDGTILYWGNPGAILLIGFFGTSPGPSGNFMGGYYENSPAGFRDVIEDVLTLFSEGDVVDVALTVENGGEAKLYINCALVKTIPDVDTINTTGTQWGLGEGCNRINGDWSGNIQNAAVVSRALTQDELVAICSPCEEPEPPIEPEPPGDEDQVVDPIQVGCGEYRAFIYTRGGGTLVCEIDWKLIRFSRKLDDISDASVSVPAGGFSNEECCACLAQIEPWKHELVLNRDGVEEWVGPVLDVSYSRDEVTINARDLFMWFERRILPFDHDSTQDLAYHFAQYAADALSGDNSMGITVSPTPTGITGHRQVAANLYRRAADELREIARTGVDFTVLAREIRCGGEEIPGQAVVTLSDSNFDGVTATFRGLAMATKAIVVGAHGSETETPVSATVGGMDADYGLVEQVWNEPSILDLDSAQASAGTHHDLLKQPPLYLSGRLLANAPLTFASLVPGIRMDYEGELGCRTIGGQFRFQNMDVTVTAEDNGTDEDIRLTLTPLGTVGDA